MRIAITRADASDSDRLIALMATFYAEEGYPFAEASTRRALAQLLGDSSLGAVWALRGGEEIVGYLVVTLGFSLEFRGRDAFVDELFVLPEHRGQGWGADALAVAEEFCRSAGVAALHLEVERENLRAKALYDKRGWKEHSRHLMTKWLA